jgi:hypothetical protein
MLDTKDMSLYSVLGCLNMTTREHENLISRSLQRRYILKDGEVVFCGLAGDVWQWLRDSKQIK